MEEREMVKKDWRRRRRRRRIRGRGEGEEEEGEGEEEEDKRKKEGVVSVGRMVLRVPLLEIKRVSGNV